MSKIINELVGKKCKISCSDGLTSEICHVLEVDEDWVKMRYDSKKEKDCIKIIRIDTVDHIEVIEN